MAGGPPLDEEAAFIRYSYLVRAIASQLAERLNYDFAEAYSDGCLGLLKAIRRFQPGQVPFPCYAKWLIRGEILDGIRRMRPGARRSMRDADEPVREVSLSDFDQAVTEAPRRVPRQLQVAPVVFQDAFEDEALAAAWLALPVRVRLVLNLRFVHEMEVREIAAVLRVCPSRVSQLVGTGLDSLRSRLGARIFVCGRKVA